MEAYQVSISMGECWAQAAREVALAGPRDPWKVGGCRNLRLRHLEPHFSSIVYLSGHTATAYHTATSVDRSSL